ncbi:YgiQ family radical SAM protein [Desulfosarcina ovata]|uniref:YgiQ family radical SAM protein n=1 Tax=Desulfosarcina ovata subsp. ovata TaxID=2752305 RepID=A0A5K8A9R7_9BACT|nr:YgiQ family radical SAM protein [Desulfosarcina ovata]BBO89229.1 YgiQ family radical SAM protein [Desulfosarcina ovata subsp. ovata]
MNCDFLPVSQSDMRQRGWDRLDVILITGDAYVDHPAFGVALIGRVLAAHGYRVGIIAQPDWRNADDFRRLGRPRLFFGITSGNVDSMVANYTANKRPRRKDAFSPGGRVGMRPDRALVVYANRVRQAFKGVPVVIGGLEASMRRLAHYDFWDNRVRRSILFDARADILVYGMGEAQVVEIARQLMAGEPVDGLDGIAGTAVIRKDPEYLGEIVALPSFEDVGESADRFNEAFRRFYRQQNPFTGRPVVQAHGDRWAVVFPPPKPLSETQLDAIYDLDYPRRWHLDYDGDGGVPALETVRHSLVTHRGCSGECNFCSLYFHQGRVVQSRSEASILREARRLVQDPAFHGTITDMGGPTANLYGANCPRWSRKGFCADRRCMVPATCSRLDPGYARSLPLYRQVRGLPGVKHAFIGSGFRHDLFGDASTDACLEELCRFHISGRMKVAPEHVCDMVLDAMGKPPIAAYDAFVAQFKRVGQRLPAPCFLVNYFISAHPGATLGDALKMARYLIERGMHPEQIQDFIPLPLTLSGAMYHTEKDPFSGRPLHVAKTFRERKMQRALIQYNNPANRPLIRQALKALGAEHLAPMFFRGKGAARKTIRRSEGRKRPTPGPPGPRSSTPRKPAARPGARPSAKRPRKSRR